MALMTVNIYTVHRFLEFCSSLILSIQESKHVKSVLSYDVLCMYTFEFVRSCGFLP